MLQPDIQRAKPEHQRLPTLKAGTCLSRALPSDVFQCIPRTEAASCRSSNGSKFEADELRVLLATGNIFTSRFRSDPVLPNAFSARWINRSEPARRVHQDRCPTMSERRRRCPILIEGWIIHRIDKIEGLRASEHP
jgi:hypothetical protein